MDTKRLGRGTPLGRKDSFALATEVLERGPVVFARVVFWAAPFTGRFINHSLSHGFKSSNTLPSLRMASVTASTFFVSTAL